MLPKAFLSTFWELDLRPEVFVAMSSDSNPWGRTSHSQVFKLAVI